MKKILLVFIAISIPIFAFGQESSSLATASGAGTSSAAAASASVSGVSLGSGDATTPTDFSFAGLQKFPQGRALLAMTTDDYPVTPGDVYSVTFLKTSDTATISLVVQNDYSVNLGVFGHMYARGMLLTDLKRKVEKKIADGYPGSSPDLVVQSTGVFTVKVDGEVTKGQLLTAWGLQRLSSIVSSVRTSYSSERKVLVRSSDGIEHTYDLFLARRNADLSNDPYVHPNDTIILSRTDRLISVAGAVYRPGTYELLGGEELRDALEYYAGGLLPSARGDYAQLIRKASGTKPEGQVLSFDAVEWKAPLPLVLDGDSVYIPSRDAFLPVIYFEGAVATGDQKLSTASAKQAGTSRYPFKPGEMLSQVLRELAPRILPTADLRRAFIARKGQAETIPVDLEKLLYNYDPSLDIALRPEDRIVIPFGSLDVFVTGEVTKSTWVQAGALSRLSDTVKPLLTPYSSVRDIAVMSASGEVRTFDLFKAERYGSLEDDPFLKSGDAVTVKVADRIVSVAGEVRRPGRYQLLPGEGLKELIEVYGGGFTEAANPARLSITSAPSTGESVGEMARVDYANRALVSLKAFDTVIVPQITELLPVAWFEGAIGVGVNGQDPQAAHRIPYTFVPGETLSHAVQALRKQFSAVSDLGNAYVLRGDTHIPIDLSTFLYNRSYAADVPLSPGDTIIIPFRQFFVSVSGAVRIPGRYPYVPDRGWEYYVMLAGGFDTQLNAGQKITIRDVKGAKVPQKNRFIEPEDSIDAATNSFFYYLGNISAILSTLTALVTAYLYVTKL